MTTRGYRIRTSMLAISETGVTELGAHSTVEIPADPGGVMSRCCAQLYNDTITRVSETAVRLRYHPELMGTSDITG